MKKLLIAAIIAVMTIVSAGCVNNNVVTPVSNVSIDIKGVAKDGSFDYSVNGGTKGDVTIKANTDVQLKLQNKTDKKQDLHLHGNKITFVSKNGQPATGEASTDTLPMNPGDVFIVKINAANVGTLLLHNHGMIAPAGKNGDEATSIKFNVVK